MDSAQSYDPYVNGKPIDEIVRCDVDREDQPYHSIGSRTLDIFCRALFWNGTNVGQRSSGAIDHGWMRPAPTPSIELLTDGQGYHRNRGDWTPSQSIKGRLRATYNHY